MEGRQGTGKEDGPLSREVNTDHRKGTHVRQDQVLSQQGRTQLVTVLSQWSHRTLDFPVPVF